MKRVNFLTIVGSALAVCAIILIATTKHCEECFSPPAMMAKLLVCGLVIIGFTVYYRAKFKEQEGVVFDVESLPLCKTDDAVEGVPFAGTGVIAAENNQLLKSPYAGKPCVYFHSVKEKYVREGKHSRWVVVENFAKFVPFHLTDERGDLNIDLANMDDDFSGFRINETDGMTPNPRYSEIDCLKLMHKERFSEKEKGILGLVSSGRYRRSEYVLEPGMEVFVCGMGKKTIDGQTSLREDARCPLIITTKSREQYAQEFYRGANVLFLSYFLVALGFSLSFWAANYFLGIQKDYFWAIMAFVDTAIVGGIVISLFNRMVHLQNRAEGAVSNIEVELKRRADLIPNLAALVKNYAEHEKIVQESTARARATIVFSQKEAAAGAAPLAGLMAIAEKYPELKASDNFRELARELSDTESRIAYSREFYNRTAQRYNTLSEQFPFVVVARLFGFKAMQFVSISHGG